MRGLEQSREENSWKSKTKAYDHSASVRVPEHTDLFCLGNIVLYSLITLLKLVLFLC